MKHLKQENPWGTPTPPPDLVRVGTPLPPADRQTDGQTRVKTLPSRRDTVSKIIFILMCR